MKLFVVRIFCIEMIACVSIACTSSEKKSTNSRIESFYSDQEVFDGKVLHFVDLDSTKFYTDNIDEYIWLSQKYATVFFDYDCPEPLRLRTRSEIKLYFNNPDKDQYFLLSLLSKTDTEYRVVVWDALTTNPLSEGYVSRSTPLRIFSRVDYLNVYQTPDSLSASIEDTFRYYSDPIPVVDFSNRWLRIRRNDPDAEIIEGWIPPSEQCSNVFTTCS
ncbi:MAG: hypothetical protein ACI4US_06795 [Muribaculaceae bacterium]